MKKIHLSDLLENNRFLKILSVLVAVIAWFLISTTVDPNASTTIQNVPITIDLNNTTPGSSGLRVVSTTPLEVDVNVQGMSYEIGKLKASDFIVTPTNLNEITQPGVHELNLTVKTTATLHVETKLTVRPSSFFVQFDRIEKKTFSLQASAPNKEAEEGYYIDQYIASPNEVVVSGPESVVSQIAHCVVENNDMMIINNSTAIDGNLVFYDGNGQQINSEALDYGDINFKISIPLYKKVALPFTFEFINVPKNIDTSQIEYTMSPVDKITVGIPVDAAAGIESISLGQVDFRRLDVDKSFSFDVSLLAGYINIDDINQVNISFLNDEYDKVYLSSSNIVTANVPTGYQVEIISGKVSDIRFVGKKDIIQDLTSEDVVVTADFSNVTNLTTGEQRVPVSISLVDNTQAWAVGEKSILVSVKEITSTE